MAAKRYFNVSASELNVTQAATIAAITKNPQNFDPSVEANQKEAEHQRNIVLQLMHDQGLHHLRKGIQRRHQHAVEGHAEPAGRELRMPVGH